MTLQYDQKTINDQPEQGEKTYVFDSNSATQSDIIFNNWTSLLNVLTTVTGKKKILFPDGANEIPAGTYDMTDITLTSNNATTTIEINDAVLNNLDGIENVTLVVGLTAANTVPSLVYASGGSETLLSQNGGFSVGALAVAALIDVSAATALLVRNFSTTYSSVNGAVPVIALSGAGGAALNPASGNGGNDYGGTAGSAAFATIPAGTTLTVVTGTGDVFFSSNLVVGGTLTITRDADYEVGTPADWVGSPLDVKSALDRIASVVAGAHGAIP